MRTRRKRASSPKFDSQYSWNVYLTKWTDFRVNCIPEDELPLCQKKSLENNARKISTKERISNVVINTKAGVLETWSDYERDLFTQRFVNVGKNFPLIASTLPDKTVAQCIHYYYLTKHKICYKQLRKIANEEEHGTRSVKSRGFGKGNNKAEKDVDIVLEHKPKELLYTTYDSLKCEEGFSGYNERTEKPGTSTATIRENSSLSVERVRGNAYNDSLIIDGRPKGNARSSSVNEGGFYRPRELCTASKLLSKTCQGNDAFNSYERPRNSKGKTFVRPGISDQIMSINKRCQGNGKDLSSKSIHEDNMQPAIPVRLIQDIKDAPTNSHHDVIFKKNITEGASTAYDAPKTAQYPEILLGTMATTSKNYDSFCEVLDPAKKGGKIQGKCFHNLKINSSKQRQGVATRVANGQIRGPFKKITAGRQSTYEHIHKTTKEASNKKNKSLISRTKEREGPNPAKNHLDAFYWDDEMMADYSPVSSIAKKRKVENILEVRSPNNCKRHGNYDHLKMAKKNRCIPQSAETSHSSILPPENTFRLVSGKDVCLSAADQKGYDPCDIGDNGDLSYDGGYFSRNQFNSERMSRKMEESLINNGKYFEKQTASLDQFFDEIDGLLFNTPRLEKASRKPYDNLQRNNSGISEVTMQLHSKSFQGPLIRTVQHGKRPLNRKGSAKNKTNHSCYKKSSTTKSCSSCCKNQFDNEIINRSDVIGSEYEQTGESSSNIKLTKRTFDLASVFYKGILDQCKTLTCGQSCSDDDLRKTSAGKSKKVAKLGDNKKGKLPLKRLSAVGHSTAKKLRADNYTMANGKRSRNRQVLIVDRGMEELNKPTTPTCYCFDNSFSTKETSTNMDCHITCTKGDRVPRAGQQRSFMDTVIETTLTAKPSCSGDHKLAFVTNEEAKNTTKGIKRKSLLERFDKTSFKRAFVSGDNSKGPFHDQQKRLVKKNSFSESQIHFLNRTRDQVLDSKRLEPGLRKAGESVEQPTLSVTPVVTPKVFFSSYNWIENETKRFPARRKIL